MKNDIIIKQCDSLQWLGEAAVQKQLKVDCIVTDPPYWTLDKWRKIGTTTRLGGHKDPNKRREDMWFPTIDSDDLWQAFCNLGEILADNAHAYIFCDHEVLVYLLKWARESEMSDVFNYSKPLVWDKINPGMGYHWRAQTEYIVMLEKGKRRLNNLSWPDILKHKRVSGKGHYPTEKPLALISQLIENSTVEGETVLDPFCGSGVVGEACERLNRNAILLDIKKEAIQFTQDRLKQSYLF